MTTPSDVWLQTYSGREFRPLLPHMADVSLDDIAHGLALTCRFNGACATFYSVAEHACRVSVWVMREAQARGYSEARAVQAALEALHHDDAEYIVGDVASPLKPLYGALADIERAVMVVIGQRFGFDADNLDPLVKQGDRVLLATERRDLMVPSRTEWPDLAEPLTERITPVSWQFAERQFVAEHHALHSRLAVLAAKLGF